MSFKDPSKGRGKLVKRRDMQGLIESLSSGNSGGNAAPFSASEIFTTNESGSAKPEFSVFKVGDSVFSTSQLDEYNFSHAYHEGETVSDDEDDVGKICVVQAPIGIGGEVEKAKVTGVTSVRLKGENGKSAAKLVVGEHVLEADDDGPIKIIHDPGKPLGGDERIAKVMLGGGSGGSSEGSACAEVDELSTYGNVTGGSVSLDYTITVGGDTETATIVIPWNSTISEVKAAFTAHPLIDASMINVIGYQWPVAAHHVLFKPPIQMPVAIPVISNSLTGGGGFRMRKASSSNWNGYVDV